MKQQVFYIHGGESYSDYDKFLERLRSKDIWDLPSAAPFKKWTSDLAEDLGENYEVFMPAMPNKQNAKYEEWKIWFERHFEHLRNNVVLIGCSLGSMFLAKYLGENELPVKIKALYLMATPVRDDEDFEDKESGDFRFYLREVSSLTRKVDKVFILHSKDDFLVPYSHGVMLHKGLPGSELITFTDKNHFLVEELPELIEHIKAL